LPVEVAILLFDGLTALDAVGPYEVLRCVPGAEVRFVAVEPGPKRTAGGLEVLATHRLAEVPSPDVLVVPGGGGVAAVSKDEASLDWIRRVHAGTRWTTSVCTGALVLAAAGLLEGVPATTHWRSLEALAALGARATNERVVRSGKIITSAGVSAGIDMALTLVGLELGEEMAQTVQLAIEYDPQPPYDAGSPAKAPPAIVERLRRA
jgi:transcriptional regulator GlxA family with amidase domain